MKLGKTVTYENVLNIPEGKKGSFEIRHDKVPAGKPLMLNSMRSSFFGQKGKTQLIFNHETTWHQLLEDGWRWMSDWPIEQRQLDEQAKGIVAGRALVGGLGLGYAATCLALRPRIKEVVVVEIAQEVIDLVEPYTLKNRPERKKLKVVRADLLEYLDTTKDHFDYALYDIWASDGEKTFFKTVCPLLEKSKNKVKHRPVCWNEDVMRGQLFMSIQQRLMLLDNPQINPKQSKDQFSLEYLATPRGDVWHDWMVPYFQWLQNNLHESKEYHQEVARIHAATYGWKPALRGSFV